MDIFSWFNSSDQVDAALVVVAIIGAVIELGVAVAAVINVHKEIEESRKKKLEKYIEVFACVAAFFFMAEAILGWRSSMLLAIELEGLRKVNNELKAQIQPRRLTGTNRVAIANSLSNSPWGIVVVSTIFDGESEDFGDDFNSAFHEANWQTRRWVNFTGNWSGVSIGMLEGSIDAVQSNRIKQVSAALKEIGIPNEEKTIGESRTPDIGVKQNVRFLPQAASRIA